MNPDNSQNLVRKKSKLRISVAVLNALYFKNIYFFIRR